MAPREILISACRRAAAALACFACFTLPGPVAAVTIYDPALGLPGPQGWSALSNGLPGTEVISAGHYLLDSTGAGVSSYGRGRVNATPLDTNAGFTLTFDLRVLSESHSSANRAGFSILMVGSDPTHALELAFWTNEVFTYDYVAADADKFVHGAGALLDTTASFQQYTLTVQNQNYVLSAGAGAATLITGALKDYTGEGSPYTLPNFLFFGDDTSRGTASIELGPIVLSAVPELPRLPMMLLGLGALALMFKRRQRLR